MQVGYDVQLYLEHLNRIVSGDFNLRWCIQGHLARVSRGGPETERRDHLILVRQAAGNFLLLEGEPFE